MSETISPKIHLKYGVEMVCRLWRFPRSSYYSQHRRLGQKQSKRGRQSHISDNELLEAIRKCIASSPFEGEGHRKIHARLRRLSGIRVGRNRVLRLMSLHQLLSPHRSPKGKVNPHDGRITTDSPNQMWATDATKILTLEDGWVWFFGIIEHWNAECLGWHLTKKGDRYASIEALTQAIEHSYGRTVKDVARGPALRVDHGSQFLSSGFVNQTRYWGIGISKGFVREPETNGVIERFHRTLKEQIIHGVIYHSIHDLQIAVRAFIARYNKEWLLEKLNYHSPLEARRLYDQGENVLRQSRGISSKLLEQEEERGYFVLAYSSISDHSNFVNTERERELDKKIF